ncbi:MAG: 50S ribosomal protein L4 [Acidobacteriota bacterium]|nr:50S ribosomal protein L4 [Acidobacteriota bacterium]
MPVVDVKNLEGKTVGKLELADDVFAAEVNPHLLHEAVRHHLAGLRAGTHKTKDKSEVSGSGKKLWRQKGTGRARIGSIRSPLWRHGGTVHGPEPRSYAYALPKKMVLGALRSALTTKLSQQKLTIVDGWQLESHKTKAFRAALDKLDDQAKTILLVETGDNVNLARASRNIAGLTLVEPSRLGPYDLMRHDRLMLSREAAMRLSGALSAAKSENGSAQAAPSAELTPQAAKAAAKPKRSAKTATRAAKKPATKKSAPKPKAKKE